MPFLNPSSVGLLLLWDNNVLVDGCRFTYFDGFSDMSLVATLRAWCGILSQNHHVYNVAVKNNEFNGNASMQSYVDCAADGLLWLGNGGQWLVQSNRVENYRFEGVQLQAGPYTVVANAFSTKSGNGASCALNTMHNAATNNASSVDSRYAAYCFVNNTITGGITGVLTPPLSSSLPGPYRLVISANLLDLATNGYAGANDTRCFLSTYVEAATLAGNQAVHAGRAIEYYNPGTSTPYYGNPLTLRIQCNDFSYVTNSSFYCYDPSNRLREAQFRANKLGTTGTNHMCLAGLPTPPTDLPITTFKGNQFWYNGSCPLATSVALSGSVANNFTGWLGNRFQVGPGMMAATHLGRWNRSGNTQPHTVKIFDANNNSCAEVTVNPNGQPTNEWVYTELAGTGSVPLYANSTYYLVSSESNGYDYWYDYYTRMGTSGATVNCAVSSPTNQISWQTVASTSYTYGPVNFMCCWLYPRVGPNWVADAGSEYGSNSTGQYKVNNPNQFADSSFSLY